MTRKLLFLARPLFGALTLTLAASLVPAHAAPPKPGPGLQGVVTKVVDGATLWITPPGQPPVLVKLRDTDAPESCQPWAEESRLALTALALNKPATVRTAGRDGQGRTLGVVVVADVDVGQRMVEDGQAFSVRTKFDNGPLVKQERMAHALVRGMYAHGVVELPREFRRSHAPCAVAAPAVAPVAPAQSASASIPRTPSRASAR